jgi:hypothetical protein
LARDWLIKKCELGPKFVSGPRGGNLLNFNCLKKFAAIAFLAGASFLGTGCLIGGGGSLTNLPESELAEVNLQIRLGRVDADAPADGGVNAKKSADLPEEAIKLRDMVLRFTSNLRDTVWDTVTAGVGTSFSGDQSEDQAVSVNVALQPLRWWNIEIKTHDVFDSIIHYANVGPIPSKGGQAVSLDVPLINSRFSFYEARYVLPVHIYSDKVPVEERFYQKIFFSRLILSIDSNVVRDTTSFDPTVTSPGTRYVSAGTALRGADGKFFFRPSSESINSLTGLLDTITHVQTYKYVRTGPRNFNIKAYGFLEGDTVTGTPRLLFEGNSLVAINPGAASRPLDIVLDWMGPGSDKVQPDTTDTIKAGHPNWNGIALEVTIGQVKHVEQTIIINPGVP